MVAKITILQDGGQEKPMSIRDFVSLRITVRTKLIVERKVKFLDKTGKRIPSLEAIKFLGQVSRV